MMCTSRQRKIRNWDQQNQLLVHLFTQYGDINPDNIAENDKCFREPWDVSEPFANISEQFDKCIEYARAALSPYSEAQIMNQATLVVYNTGLFFDNLQKWDAMPAAPKSYEEVCNHIWEAQQVFCRQQPSKESGYGLAIQEIHDLAENITNTAAINWAEHQAAQATKDKEKAATGTAQKELIKALTTQVEALVMKQNQRFWPNSIYHHQTLQTSLLQEPQQPQDPNNQNMYWWTKGAIVGCMDILSEKIMQVLTAVFQKTGIKNWQHG
jgi:hypothetical protein